MTQPQIELIAINKAVEIIKSHIDSYSADVSEDKQERYLSIRLALGAVLQEIEQLPRSSPQAAPGLRDAWNAFEEKAIASNGYFDLYANRWPEYDVLRDAIAAAQGGTVVDRSALNDIIDKLAHAVKDVKEHYGEVKVATWGDGSDCALKHTFSFVEIVKQTNALDQFDFNSAVPSAPGSERVQKAWAAFHHEEITGAQIPNQWDYCYAELKHSIEALGQPQGADSQWSNGITDTERAYIRFIARALHQMREDAERVLAYDEYRQKTINPGNVVVMESCIERQKDNKGTMAFVDEIYKWLNRLAGTQPAQPVAAGEAKERGE